MAAAAAAPPFALTPALTNNAVIDYTTSEGIKIYKAATYSLYGKEEEAFDCLPDGLHDFLSLLKVRADNNGWNNSILAIPDDIQNPLGDAKDFLTSYGDITMEHLREHAETLQLPTSIAKCSKITAVPSKSLLSPRQGPGRSI